MMKYKYRVCHCFKGINETQKYETLSAETTRNDIRISNEAGLWLRGMPEKRYPTRSWFEMTAEST